MRNIITVLQQLWMSIHPLVKLFTEIIVFQFIVLLIGELGYHYKLTGVVNLKESEMQFNLEMIILASSVSLTLTFLAYVRSRQIKLAFDFFLVSLAATLIACVAGLILLPKLLGN